MALSFLYAKPFLSSTTVEDIALNQFPILSPSKFLSKVDKSACPNVAHCNAKRVVLRACSRDRRQTTNPAPPILGNPDMSKGIQAGLIPGQEVTTPIPLRIFGELPAYLGSGVYYQNGPCQFPVKHKDGQPYEPGHWFDCFGMVRAFFFDTAKGTVHYRCKMISEAVKRTIESVPKDDYVAVSISQGSRKKSISQKLKHALAPLSVDPLTDRRPINVNVTLQQLPTKGILNASTDANFIHRLDPNTLEVVEEYDFSHFQPGLTGAFSSSHGILDLRTGEYFNFVVNYVVGKTTYKVFRIKPDGQTEILTTITDYPYYIHSFSLSENYVILIMCPCEVNMLKIMLSKSFTDGLRMRPRTPTRFVVISRNSSKIVRSYEHSSFFCLHTVNAFERGDDIVIDLTMYKDAQVLSDMSMENLNAGADFHTGRLTRFTLPRISDVCKQDPKRPHAATSEVLASFPFELGLVTPEREQRRHRYVFGLSDAHMAGFCGTVTKLDVDSRRVWHWSSRGTLVGEPLFVQNPSARGEDDGCLLVMTLDSLKNRSALIILDARNMTEIARAVLPMTVPLGAHGFFKRDITYLSSGYEALQRSSTHMVRTVRPGVSLDES